MFKRATTISFDEHDQGRRPSSGHSNRSGRSVNDSIKHLWQAQFWVLFFWCIQKTKTDLGREATTRDRTKVAGCMFHHHNKHIDKSYLNHYAGRDMRQGHPKHRRDNATEPIETGANRRITPPADDLSQAPSQEPSFNILMNRSYPMFLIVITDQINATFPVFKSTSSLDRNVRFPEFWAFLIHAWLAMPGTIPNSAEAWKRS